MNTFWPVVGPTSPAIKGVEMLDILCQSVLGVLPSYLFQPQIGKYAEPQPVGVWHARACK